MKANEQLEQFLKSPEVAKAVEEMEAIDYKEPMKNGWRLWEAMEEEKKGLKKLDGEVKADPWRMIHRYLPLFRMHYAYTGMVHPLMNVGKDRLTEWRETVDEFEALFSGKRPVVSLVTQGTIGKIRHLIPEEILQSFGNPNHYILAAFRYLAAKIDGDFNEDRLEVAGILSFTIREEDERTVHIDWLKTLPEHQEAEPENSLISEMLYMLKDADIAAYIFDLPAERLVTEEGTALVWFLENWHFEATIMPDEEVVTHVGNLVEAAGKLPEQKADVTIRPLNELEPTEFKRGVKRFMELEPEVYDSNLAFIEKAYFHQEISCFAKGADGSLQGLLLAYVNHRKELYVAMVRGESEEISTELIRSAIKAAAEWYPKKQQVILPVKREFSADFVDMYLPETVFDAKLRFVLLAPEEDMDMTSEEWEEACAAL